MSQSMQSGIGPTVLLGDCREILKTLPGESVHCVVTSPPYWGLRDYGVEGQIGLEPTPEAHIAALLEVFREVRRVLRKDGTLWLNYGDCYATSPAGNTPVNGRIKAGVDGGSFRANKPFATIGGSLKPKDLCGMPWRLAFALQADGWYLRSDIIWSKPNPMPESVIDRPTRAHEYVFLLAKSGRYFYDADAIREPHTVPLHSPGNRVRAEMTAGPMNRNGKSQWDRDMSETWGNPAGRNKRTVWEIATQPTPEAHFATFPEALVEPCILAGTSERGVCPECGAPWARRVEKSFVPQSDVCPEKGVRGVNGQKPMDARSGWQGVPRGSLMSNTTRWQPTCAHDYADLELVPAVVLDPFGGSGTVGKVATRLGRQSILIELNPEYITIAEKRTAQRGLGL